MGTQIWATAIKKTNDFYASNKAFHFFLSITTIFSLLQVILFATNNMQVNGNTLDKTSVPLLTWLLLAVSIVATYCGFVGGIMMFRGSLSFVYWQTTATSLSFITQALAQMWFGALVSLYFILMNMIRFYAWKHDLIEKWNWSSAKVMWVGFAFFILVFGAMNSVATIWGDEIYLNNSDWMNQWNANFDATGASLNMTASFVMLFKVRWAFMIYAVAKVFTISNYACAGLIVPIVQMMLFWIMDFTGFIGWSLHILEPEDTNFEEI